MKPQKGAKVTKNKNFLIKINIPLFHHSKCEAKATSLNNPF